MKRRLNYTERKRINLDGISVKIVREGGKIRCFDASLHLDDLGLSEDASVYLEAYHQHELARYNFGKVRNPEPEGSTDLSELARHENLLFRVLVVDESGENGLLLVSAEKIKPVDEGKGEHYKRSILPVDFQDLGRLVWKVVYDDDSPVLQINKNIPNIPSIAKIDARFFMHIYPSIIREVLTHMIFVDGVDDMDEPEFDWHRNWLDFTKQIMPNVAQPTYLQPKQGEFEASEVCNWIDQVVTEFCASRGSEWRRYIGMEEGN